MNYLTLKHQDCISSFQVLKWQTSEKALLPYTIELFDYFILFAVSVYLLNFVAYCVYAWAIAIFPGILF